MINNHVELVFLEGYSKDSFYVLMKFILVIKFILYTNRPYLGHIIFITNPSIFFCDFHGAFWKENKFFITVKMVEMSQKDVIFEEMLLQLLR